MDSLPTPIVPRPPLAQSHWRYTFQRDFFSPRGEFADTLTLKAAEGIAKAIDATCHGYGVTVTKGLVSVRGHGVTVILEFAAGEWRGNMRMNTTTSGHPAGRLCSRILRYLQGKNEELG
jgi:hypothetical protein